MTEQWVTMKEASSLLKTTQSKISRLAAIKAIEVREHIADRRTKLVNVEQVKRVLSTSTDTVQLEKEIKQLEKKVKKPSRLTIVESKEDMSICLDISQAVFGCVNDNTLDECMEMLKINPYMCYAIKSNNEIVGYMGFNSLKLNKINNVLSQTLPVKIPVSDIEVFEPTKTIDLYINVMVIKPDVSLSEKRLYGFRLISGLMDFIVSLGEKGIIIKTIAARSNTSDGIRLLKHFGFTEIERATPERRTFIIDIEKSGIPFIEQYKLALKEWNNIQQT